MWTVTKIRADYEGWWLFSDWPENIVEKYQYQDFDDMFKHYQQLDLLLMICNHLG